MFLPKPKERRLFEYLCGFGADFRANALQAQNLNHDFRRVAKDVRSEGRAVKLKQENPTASPRRGAVETYRRGQITKLRVGHYVRRRDVGRKRWLGQHGVECGMFGDVVQSPTGREKS